MQILQLLKFYKHTLKKQAAGQCLCSIMRRNCFNAFKMSVNMCISFFLQTMTRLIFVPLFGPLSSTSGHVHNLSLLFFVFPVSPYFDFRGNCVLMLPEAHLEIAAVVELIKAGGRTRRQISLFFRTSF